MNLTSQNFGKLALILEARFSHSIQLMVALSLLACSLDLTAQNAEVIKLGRLEEIMTSKSKPTLVINFWATWCAPCVKEMPLIEKLGEENIDVQVTLVSLDLDLDPNPEKVYKFVDRKKLRSRVVILDERDANSYIPKIEKDWSGALPATIVINSRSGKRTFHEGELHPGELEKMIAEIK